MSQKFPIGLRAMDQQATFAPRTDAIVTLVWVGRRCLAPIGGSHLFFLCPSKKPLRCKSIVYAAAELGNRRSVTKSARSHARAAFFIGIRNRRVSFSKLKYWQVIWRQPGIWKADVACD